MENVDFSSFKDLDWVIALSGGADSRLLLELAAENRKLCKTIKAVYVNHHLQKISDSWASFCMAECQKLEIDCIVEDVYVSTKGSIEANARDARYKALEKHIAAKGVLFTAHHADDLLESVLLAFIRGSGLDGIAAMPKIRKFGLGVLARPLIELSRQEIEQACSIRKLSFVTDPTNKDTAYDRNFLRHEITPLLKQRFPQILKNTNRAVTNLCADKVIIDGYLEELVGELKTSIYGALGLKNDRLKLLSENEQYSALRYFLKHECGLVLSRAQLGAVLSLDKMQEGNKAFFNVEGQIISLYRNIIYTTKKPTCPLEMVHIKPNQAINMEGMIISLNSVSVENECHEFVLDKKTEAIASVFFLEKDDDLILDFNPKSSTRLAPVNRQHSQLLKNIWKEFGVPLYLRWRHPLVKIEDNNQGVFGVFMDKNAKKQGNEFVLKIEFI